MANASLLDYLRLMRLDKPIGIWLVFFPAAWGVLLATPDIELRLLITMLLGAVTVRSAGCIINDIADHKLDAQVERTRARPLASGRISLMHASMLLATLLCAALTLALSLPSPVLLVAILAVPMIAAYPWMKRITYWPQLFLGLTFNLGAIIGWLSTGAPLSTAPIALYLACVFWTLAYDTIYAMQDAEDDTRIGIKSTALLLGDTIPLFVTGCFIAMELLLLLAGYFADAGPFFLLGMGFMAWQMRQQVKQLRSRDIAPGKLFASNQWPGLTLTLALLADRLLT